MLGIVPTLQQLSINLVPHKLLQLDLQIHGASGDLQGNVPEWVYDTEIGFGDSNNGYFGYTPESAFGLMRGGGFGDPPSYLVNTFIYEQMDRQAVQGHVGIRLVRRLEY